MGARRAEHFVVDLFMQRVDFPGKQALVRLVDVLVVGFFLVLAAIAAHVTVFGAPWTTGTAAIGVITAMGGAAPASNTGAASGTVSLVTPIYVHTNQGVDPVIPAFAFLDLHFVPEPGTLVLVGAGIVGLCRLGQATRKQG